MKMGKSDKSAIANTGPAWLVGATGHVLRWALLPVAAVGTIVGVGIATGGVGSTAVMAALADPLSVLAARSPGARAAGALTQTKNRKVDAPSERVLASVLTRPLDRFAAPGLGGGTPGTTTGPVGDTVTEAVNNADAPPVPIDAVVPGPVPGGFIGTPGGFVVTPGGGGPSGGGVTTPTPTPTPTPTSTPPVVVPPVSSVPEPETWLTMLFGFAAVGGALRWRRRSLAPLVAAKAAVSRAPRR